MKKRTIEYGEVVRQLYGDRHFDKNNNFSICRNITFQITSNCNLKCSYCYEHHKCNEDMTIETGKRIVDYIFDLYEKNDGDFINQNAKAVVLEFIGGEPLIKAKLIEQICDYYFEQGLIRNIPFIPYTRISFATNGVAWFTDEAQHLIQKYKDFISVTVSIDGVQELHDMYRLDIEGKGSFDRAYKAFKDAQKYGWYGSKMTFVPDSFKYIFDSVKMMIGEGCTDIHCNYAYEPIYTAEDAHNLFEQLRKLADYLIKNKLDVAVSILNEDIGGQNLDDQNYCGGTGNMLSFAPDGNAYPCIRYAPISVGKEKADKMLLGDCFDGLYHTKEQQERKEMLDAITMTSQSTQECVDCPVGKGCGWCSGYNYETTGTPNKRLTNICLAHKARVLSTCYYINKRYIELGDCDPKKVNLPYEEAVELIGEDNALDVYTYEYMAALKYAQENNLELIDDEWVRNAPITK